MGFIFRVSVIYAVIFMCNMSTTSQSFFAGKPYDLPDSLSSYDCSGPSYSWVKRGALKRYMSTQPLSKDVSYFLYTAENKITEIVTDSTLASVSEVLKMEDIRGTDFEIVSNIISGFIVGSMTGGDVYIIDKNYLDNFSADVKTGARSENHLRKLRSLLKDNEMSGIKIDSDEDKWKASLYITTPRNGVEQLHVYGSFNPLDVNRIDRVIVYKNGELELAIGL
jgi:hypothetical protein